MYLIVQPLPSGTKSWAVRGRVKGRAIKYTIGLAQVFDDLGHVRDEARDILKKMKQGIDPKAEREARLLAERRDDIANVTHDYVERYAKRKTRERSWRETQRILTRYVVPEWKGRSVQAITRRDVEDLVHTKARTAPIQANQTLAAIKTLFTWCVAEEIIAKSPAHGVAMPSPKTSRDRVLDDHELALIWQAAGDIAPPFDKIIRILIVTAQRRGEVAGMTWDEVDLAKALWSLPGERTKNGNSHTVPLSALALKVLGSVPKVKGGEGYVFTHDGGTAAAGFSQAKRQLDRRIAELNGEPLKPWVIHDIRRAVVTGLQKLKVPLEVTEAILNHRSGSITGVAATYHRHDFLTEGREALDRWGDHVASLVDEKSTTALVLSADINPLHATG